MSPRWEPDPNVRRGREFNGETDHKGVSSRRLRQELSAHIRRYLWGQHFWSPSYFAGSRGGAPLSLVKEYIDQQKRPD